jgi:acyl-CoA synthetase (AMP-forming)/AMP-acid ligase II
MMVIGDLLRHNARRIPNGEAIVSGDDRISWGELNTAVNRLANGLLANGILPGDRLAFIFGNTITAVQLYYAAAKIGAVSVPIMPRSVAREIAYIVNTVGATAVFASADQAQAVQEALPQLAGVKLTVGAGSEHGLPIDISTVISANAAEPEVAVDPDSPYAIIFTSGTTGTPKGCVLGHRNKVLSRMNMLMHVAYEENDRALLFLPLMASLGADMLHTHVLRGMTTVLMSRFDEAEILRLIEAERITVLYVIESTFDRLIAHEHLDRIDWGSIRYFLATSATRDVREGVTRLRQLPNFRARFWNGYGCTEGGGWLTFMGPDEIEAAASGGDRGEHYRSIGRECMMANVDCVDEAGVPAQAGVIGELVLSSPWLYSGYWSLPDKTAEVLRDGHYYTGDLARKDAAGYVYLEGRMKDMIKTGGVSVYPAEIELVLKGHPKVKEVAVVGVSDAQWGEKVIACVIANGPCDEAELINYCKRELAGFKAPKAIAFMQDFPRDIVGKILKRELRKQLSSSAGVQGTA